MRQVSERESHQPLRPLPPRPTPQTGPGRFSPLSVSIGVWPGWGAGGASAQTEGVGFLESIMGNIGGSSGRSNALREAVGDGQRSATGTPWAVLPEPYIFNLQTDLSFLAFIYLLVCLFIHSLHSFTNSFIHSLTHTLNEYCILQIARFRGSKAGSELMPSGSFEEQPSL